MPMVLSWSIVYSRAWEPAYEEFEKAKQDYRDKMLEVNDLELQRECNETGRGYEIYPEILNGLKKWDQLLDEMTQLLQTDFACLAVPYVSLIHPPGGR